MIARRGNRTPKRGIRAENYTVVVLFAGDKNRTVIKTMAIDWVSALDLAVRTLARDAATNFEEPPVSIHVVKE